jgi:HAD superfamily hydrolase (TIGR01509 family)
MSAVPLYDVARRSPANRGAMRSVGRGGVSALIFDVDGTLADTEETHRQAFNYAFLAFGLEWEWSKPRYRELLKTSGGKERIVLFVDALHVSQGERTRLAALAPAIHREKTRLYAELIADGRCPPRPGVLRLLAEAREAGVRLAIASTTSPQNVDALLTRHLGAGALRMFDAIACGDHVPRKKPAPDIYRLALAMLGLPSSACVAFEDSPNGLRAAKTAGLFTVVTPSPWTTGEAFRGADLELPHLGDENHVLPADIAAALGGSWLGLGAIDRLHAAAAHRTLRA